MAGPPALFDLKFAVTVVLALTVNEQAPVPLQAPPLHPTKALPAEGLAVSVAMVPGVSDSLQVLPQLSNPPVRLTVPVPVPILATESTPWGVGMNVAVTFLAALMVTVQDPVPEQSPPHPEKVYPVPTTADSVTTVPAA